MRFHTALVNWHNQHAVYSLDWHPSGRLATGGADKLVKIWKVSQEPFKVDFLATLSGHAGPVHTVRFSPDGTLLASVCDGGFVKLWRLDEGGVKHDFDDVHEFDQERWMNVKQLKGCQQGLYDLAWSPCSRYLFTGSLDNTAQVWDVHGHKAKMHEFTEHQHFVQGVAWDPWNSALVTQSSDRALRIYPRKKFGQTKTAYQRPITVRNRSILVVRKAKKESADVEMIELDADTNASVLPPSIERQPSLIKESNENDSNNASTVTSASVKMFHGENLATFFRRCAFSPDGRLLVAPTGILVSDPESDDLPENTTWVFARNKWTAPLYHLRSPNKPSLAVRFSPNLYKLKDGANLTGLNYRMVFAVVSFDCLAIYDTQHAHPLALVQDSHYADLSDLAWTRDGLILAVSSQDGYCSFLMLNEDELGDKLSEVERAEAMRFAERARTFDDEREWQEKTGKKREKKEEKVDAEERARNGKKSDKRKRENSDSNASPDAYLSVANQSVNTINAHVDNTGDDEDLVKSPVAKRQRVVPELASVPSQASPSTLQTAPLTPLLDSPEPVSPVKRRIAPTLISTQTSVPPSKEAAPSQQESSTAPKKGPEATMAVSEAPAAPTTTSSSKKSSTLSKSGLAGTPTLERFFSVKSVKPMQGSVGANKDGK